MRKKVTIPGRKATVALALCMALAGCSGAGPLPASGEGESEAVSIAADNTPELSADDQAAVDAFVSAQEMRQGTEQDIPIALTAAQEANPDICAWLYVPGTNVGLAVARHPEDDSYYMTHGAEKSASPVGSAYMESANSPGFDDPVTVLYGHSFSDAEIMFTQLHRFEDAGFFDKHEEFFVYLPDKVLTYRIVGACLYSDKHIVNGTDFSNLDATQAYFDFVTDDDSEAFFGLKRRTERLDADSDHLVQLSSCTLPSANGVRYVVTGVLEKEGVDDEG